MGVYIGWGFVSSGGSFNNATWTIHTPPSNVVAQACLASITDTPSQAQASVWGYTVVGGQFFPNQAPVLVASEVTSVTFHLHVAGSGEVDIAFTVFT